MKILVTGGCGYKGSVLVPKLLAAGHEVFVVDTQWFGNSLAPHERLRVAKLDIREGVYCGGIDTIIHLAGIANDPCGELDARLTWEVNVLATLFLARAAEKAGVRRFIFASSASVYGIKDNEPVDENTDMTPVSDYNKTKMAAERVLLSHADSMAIQIIRPATVCGMSPRMRLDTVVNMLTMQALSTGKIIAHCGSHGAALMRPNTHIEDITDLYCWLLTRRPETVIYNAGFENLSVGDTAELIRGTVNAQVEVSEVADKRSYCVDSSKVLRAGFVPKHSVADAIHDIADAYLQRGFRKEPHHTNLHWMQSKGLVRNER